MLVELENLYKKHQILDLQYPVEVNAFEILYAGNGRKWKDYKFVQLQDISDINPNYAYNFNDRAFMLMSDGTLRCGSLFITSIFGQQSFAGDEGNKKWNLMADLLKSGMCIDEVIPLVVL